MTDIYDNTEAFALMSDEKQAAMLMHEDNGGEFVFYDGDEWLPTAPSWLESYVYRAVRPAEKPMRVDPLVWRVLTFNFITRDQDGSVWAWAGQPITDSDDEWYAPNSNGLCCDLRIIPGLIDPGTCDWREAIVERPKGGDA